MLKLRKLLARDDGGSAVEMALFAPIFLLPLVSVVDFGLYMYTRIQVEFAAQATVAAVHRACAFTNIPITNETKCTSAVRNAQTLKSVIDSAVQSSSLGNRVTVTNTCSSGSNCWDIESYYCVNSSGRLQEVTTGLTRGKVSTSGAASTSAATTQPTCSSVPGGSTTQKPGDYLNIKASFYYRPVFGPISIGSLLQGNVTKEAFLRVG